MPISVICYLHCSQRRYHSKKHESRTAEVLYLSSTTGPGQPMKHCFPCMFSFSFSHFKSTDAQPDLDKFAGKYFGKVKDDLCLSQAKIDCQASFTRDQKKNFSLRNRLLNYYKEELRSSINFVNFIGDVRRSSVTAYTTILNVRTFVKCKKTSFDSNSFSE